MAGNVMGSGKREGLGLPTDVVEWTLEGKAVTKDDREKQEREAAEAAEVEAFARSSGDVIRVPRSIQECLHFNQAKQFVEKPADLLLVKKHCRTKSTGRHYSDAFIIRECADQFYGSLPLHEGLRKAGNELGKRPYVERAIRDGWRWTKETTVSAAA
jgi:hypothetical protein